MTAGRRQKDSETEVTETAAAKILICYRGCSNFSNISCDNTVAEQTWFGGSVSNRNGNSKTAATVEVKTWLKGYGGNGGREVTATLRQQGLRQTKLGFADTASRRGGNIKMSVIAKAAAKIWIYVRSCSKTSAMAIKTRW